MADIKVSLANELQAAIFQKLVAHTSLQSEVGGDQIYDTVPDEEIFPYIVIGEDDIARWDTHDIYGFKGTAAIYVYDQNQGRSGLRKVKALVGYIYQALHDVDLGIPNRKQLEFAFSRQQFVTEADNKTHEGMIEFTFTFGGYANG